MKIKTSRHDIKNQNSQQNISYHNDLAIEQSKLYANNFDNNDDEPYDDWEIEDYHLLTNWNRVEHNGWGLPATQDPHWWCKLWNTKGCVHKQDHHEHNGKVFVRHFQKSCFRPVCKSCWEKWIGRQSNVATRKITKYSQENDIPPIHIVLSISHWDYELDYKKMKQKARKILQEIKIRGGSIIFHPFRFNKKIKSWYYSPHFHVVGFGFIPSGSLSDAYRQNGWLIKYLGVRKSVFATFFYLLSHCGIKHRTRSIVWFGDLSYSKLEKEIFSKSGTCPLCGRKLVEIYYKGYDPPFSYGFFFEGFVDSEGWCEVVTENKQITTNFEFAPTRELNDILESLEQPLMSEKVENRP